MPPSPLNPSKAAESLAARDASARSDTNAEAVRLRKERGGREDGKNQLVKMEELLEFEFLLVIKRGDESSKEL